MPTPVHDRSDDAFHWFMKHSSHLLEAIVIFLNTFEELEGEQIKAPRNGKVNPTDFKRMPQIYPVDSLILSLPVEHVFFSELS